jgi:hypothetical protein
MPDQTTTGQRTASSKDSEPHLARSLSNRHIQLLAIIGGVIGNGLFMGSGRPSAPGRILCWCRLQALTPDRVPHNGDRQRSEGQ